MPHPIVFYTGNTVAMPGDTICVRGEDLNNLKEAVLSDGRQTVPVELCQLCAQSFKLTVPERLSPGVFTFSARSGDEVLSFELNRPVVRWLQGDAGNCASPGGWLRVNGECMRVVPEKTPSLTLCLPSGERTLAPSRVHDDYSVGFALPVLAPGEYPARYGNGFAEVPVAVRVAEKPETGWPETIYNIEAEGVPTDGHSDCTEALRALLMRVDAAGGGVVRFPKGRFHLTGCLRVPRRCVLRGEGYRKTQLFWTDEWQRPLPERDEDGWRHWEPLPLPEAMLTIAGDCAIEGMDFSAARLGGLFAIGTKELPARNVRLEGVRVNQNAFAGNLMTARHAKYNYPERCRVLGETMMDQTDMLRIFGDNVQIIGCDFAWSGRPSSHKNDVRSLLIRDTAFWGKTAVDDWMPLGTLHNAIIEDCEIREWTTGFGGDNIYFARTRMMDVIDNNREAFTTDIATGIDYAGPAAGGGTSFTFPETVDMANAMPGSKLCILSGRGAGQYRTVASVAGHTVTIEEPFAAAPDERSCLTVNAMFSNWYFVDLALDNAGALQFYTAQNNTVVDGARIMRSGGVGGWGQFVYGGVANNWYNSYVRNHFSDCNYYHMGGWYMDPALPGSSFLSASAYGKGTVNLCCMMRGNHMTDRGLLYLCGCHAPAVMEDAVLDRNRSEGCECGICVDGKPERLLLVGNECENTKIDVLRRT